MRRDMTKTDLERFNKAFYAKESQWESERTCVRGHPAPYMRFTANKCCVQCSRENMQRKRQRDALKALGASQPGQYWPPGTVEMTLRVHAGDVLNINAAVDAAWLMRGFFTPTAQPSRRG